jgi:uncharacterized protein
MSEKSPTVSLASIAFSRPGKTKHLVANLLAALAAVAAIVGLSLPAFAFTPPPLDGHVVDTANALTRDQVLSLDLKLEDVRKRSGFEIVAFIAGSLDGESREDVAYKCFNTWKIGQKGLDNGVLLLIAPHERQYFIATGKGVEGQLTDLQSDDILQQQVVPALKENRIFDAADHGTTAIARTLAGAAATSGSRGSRAKPAPPPMTTTEIGVTIGAIVLILFLAIVSSTFRSMLGFLLQLLFSGLLGGRGGGGGGDSGSGYSGGGGSTGGGGAGGDY